jgi:4-hydroxy-tetrahydrodipicolinate synthase
MSQSIFTGLSAFPLTPANDEGHVDTEGLQRLLHRILKADVQSIGLLGSTGIYMYLSRDQRRRAVAAAVEAVGQTRPLIVGVGALRTDEAQALARDAAAEGAHALLLAPVSYTPLTEEEAFRHFEAVASATDLPLCIYNNPSTTHFIFSTDLLQRLAQVPGIKAVKMPLPKDMDFASELTGLRSSLPGDFAIGYSGDWGACGALLAGADAWYSVVAGLFPEPAAALTRAASRGHGAEVEYLDKAFSPLWQLFKAHGSLRVVYAAAAHLGLTSAQPPRPLLALSPELTPALEAALAALEG